MARASCCYATQPLKADGLPSLIQKGVQAFGVCFVGVCSIEAFKADKNVYPPPRKFLI